MAVMRGAERIQIADVRTDRVDVDRSTVVGQEAVMPGAERIRIADVAAAWSAPLASTLIARLGSARRS
jgi:hypothetical protein